MAAVAALATGCSIIGARRPKPPVRIDEPCSAVLPTIDSVIAGSFVTLGIAALYTTVAHGPTECQGQEGCGYTDMLTRLFVVLPAFTVAAVEGFSALHGWNVVGTCRRGRRETAAAEIRALEEAEMTRARRGKAEAVSAIAMTAARAGDCMRVLEIELQVQSLDADVHSNTFLADPAIQFCELPEQQEAVARQRDVIAKERARCTVEREEAFLRSSDEPDPETRAKLLLAIPACAHLPGSVAAPGRRHDEARVLAIAAATRALLDGDCPAVERDTAKIRGLDAAYHDQVVAKQIDIATCLAAAAAKRAVDAQQRAQSAEARRKACLDLRATRLRDAAKLGSPRLRAEVVKNLPTCEPAPVQP